eukprot:CAMPEP_0180084686 /NCGR_PEP_ID=MMETSP0985-20121206/20008_1 /TAXON_ID=483367 /ORGANISM="non described non described, Strain CCMP 2436" /LENGTH=41 /DNA_ID= /DNA_START= /DNA_END= /DNA_ORIENTATION=
MSFAPPCPSYRIAAHACDADVCARLGRHTRATMAVFTRGRG